MLPIPDFGPMQPTPKLGLGVRHDPYLRKSRSCIGCWDVKEAGIQIGKGKLRERAEGNEDNRAGVGSIREEGSRVFCMKTLIYLSNGSIIVRVFYGFQHQKSNVLLQRCTNHKRPRD